MFLRRNVLAYLEMIDKIIELELENQKQPKTNSNTVTSPNVSSVFTSTTSTINPAKTPIKKVFFI